MSASEPGDLREAGVVVRLSARPTAPGVGVNAADVVIGSVEDVWRLANLWCSGPLEVAEAVEMTWLRVAERMDVWTSSIDETPHAEALLRDLVIGTAVEECLRARRRTTWGSVVCHARGA